MMAQIRELQKKSEFLCPMQENLTIRNQGAALERPTFLIKLLRF